MGTTGLEPGTSSVSWKRSNQLSYAPVAGRTLAVVTARDPPPVDRRGAARRRSRGRRTAVGREIDQACRDIGFFRIIGHGVDPDLLGRIDAAAREFFAQPDDAKQAIAMANAGPAWRGWFPVGGELTSGRPDRKEGLYVGAEHPPTTRGSSPGSRCTAPNLFPDEPADLGPAILEWLTELDRVAAAVMRGIAIGLGLAPTWFEEHLTGRSDRAVPDLPLPAAATTRDWGVAEHTDYGLLTLLAQDDRGGLQVHAPGGWIDVPAEPDVLVCNIGDMLDRLTRGPLPIDAAPRPQPERREPAVVPVLLRSVVGCRGRAAPARRVAARRRRRAAVGRHQRPALGRARTATTSPPRSPRSSPSCSPASTRPRCDRTATPVVSQTGRRQVEARARSRWRAGGRSG